MKGNPKLMLPAAIMFLATAIIYLILFITKHQTIHIALFAVYVAVFIMFITAYRKEIAKQKNTDNND